MQYEPIVVCKYGWGRLLRLYQKSLDLNGASYSLADLIWVQPVYKRLFGIRSARLELQFRTSFHSYPHFWTIAGKKELSLHAMDDAANLIVLRGIVEIEALRMIVQYLANWCGVVASNDTSTLEVPCLSLDSVVDADYPLVLHGDAQGVFWEYLVDDDSRASLYEQAQAPTAPMEVPGKQEASANMPREEHRVHRLKTLQKERFKRERGFDEEALARRLRVEGLPCIALSSRLLDGEIAHYSTDVALCGVPTGRITRARYHTKDRGILIFTNQRMMYLGRKRQMVLGYEQLTHFSLVDRAVEFFGEHWTGGQRFEMRRPFECCMYLECILERFRYPPACSMPQPEETPLAHALASQRSRCVELDDKSEKEPYLCVPYNLLDTEKTIRIWRLGMQSPQTGQKDCPVPAGVPCAGVDGNVGHID